MIRAGSGALAVILALLGVFIVAAGVRGTYRLAWGAMFQGPTTTGTPSVMGGAAGGKAH